MSGDKRRDEGASRFSDRLAGFLWGEEEGETTEEICAELRAEGLDPEGLIARVRQGMAAVDNQRSPAWMVKAEEEMRAEWARREAFASGSATRSEMVARVRASRQLAARKLEAPLQDMDEAELRALYEEVLWAEESEGSAPAEDR